MSNILSLPGIRGESSLEIENSISKQIVKQVEGQLCGTSDGRSGRYFRQRGNRPGRAVRQTVIIESQTRRHFQ